MHTLFCVNTTFDVTKVIPQLYHSYQNWNGTREKLYKMLNHFVVSKYQYPRMVHPTGHFCMYFADNLASPITAFMLTTQI